MSQVYKACLMRRWEVDDEVAQAGRGGPLPSLFLFCFAVGRVRALFLRVCGL